MTDKAFVFNINPFPIIGTPYEMTFPNITYPYFDDNERLALIVGEKYGYTSPFSITIDSMMFTDYYNNTFYTKDTIYKFRHKKEIIYLADPFLDADSPNTFYFLYD